MDDQRVWRRDAPAAQPFRRPTEAEGYAQLLHLAHETRFDLPAIQGVITAHPTIQRRLMAAANASQLGNRRKVTRLEHAIMLFGARGMRSFAEQALPRAVRGSDEVESSPAGEIAMGNGNDMKV